MVINPTFRPTAASAVLVSDFMMDNVVVWDENKVTTNLSRTDVKAVCSIPLLENSLRISGLGLMKRMGAFWSGRRISC